MPIEFETRTDANGSYEFAHLPIGARSFFYSAEDRGLAPSVKDLVVVQDGLGAKLDVTLADPVDLHVKLQGTAEADLTIHLIPHRWWPGLLSATIPAGEDSTAFRGLGGPFLRGVVVMEDPATADLRPIARYDLAKATEVVVSPTSVVELTPEDIPEASGLERWGDALTASHRGFFAMISPIALLWSVAAESPMFLSDTPSQAELAGTGTARGFSPQPFLPILIESRSGEARLAEPSEVSEFWVTGLPPGAYRVRALTLFGEVSFARGVYVRPGLVASLESGLGAKIERDEGTSREVMGSVCWENGTPSAKAEIFMQSLRDFRRYLRRVEADEHGYFHFAAVPGDEPYMIFAIPPGVEAPMKNLENIVVEASHREVWCDLTLHPHRVRGRLGRGAASKLQLVRLDPEGQRVVWMFSTDAEGDFSIANVPHGCYRVQATNGVEATSAQSLPFEVKDDRPEVIVRWTESSP